MSDYSVLISVYYKEKSSNFAFCLDSIINQTVLPKEIIIVCDGKLTKELDDILDEYMKKYNFIKKIQLSENVGLGKALNVGLKECSYDIIMRMDSDDYSIPTRAEKELSLIKDYDIVGSSILEFENDINNIIGKRIVPETQEKIRKFAKKRSPFNHPSVMFRKETVEKAGGYQHMLYAEDYYLWVRLLLNNAKCANISEPLVYMRSGIEMRSRRAGRKYNKSMRLLRKYMLKNKFINVFQYLYCLIGVTFISILPIKIREWIYRKFLRK